MCRNRNGFLSILRAALVLSVFDFLTRCRNSSIYMTRLPDNFLPTIRELAEFLETRARFSVSVGPNHFV